MTQACCPTLDLAFAPAPDRAGHAPSASRRDGRATGQGGNAASAGVRAHADVPRRPDVSAPRLSALARTACVAAAAIGAAALQLGVLGLFDMAASTVSPGTRPQVHDSSTPRHARIAGGDRGNRRGVVVPRTLAARVGGDGVVAR
jgi:hypothetical protein